MYHIFHIKQGLFIQLMFHHAFFPYMTVCIHISLRYLESSARIRGICFG